MSDSSDAKEALLKEILQRNAGLSRYETSVYIGLVRGGKQTMTELSESSGVPKQRVYDIIDDLRDSGFVEVVEDYPQKAYAVDPTEALAPIQRQLAQAETYLDELHETVDPGESGVTLFKSRPTIEKHLERLIEEADKDIFLLAPLDVIDRVEEPLRERAEEVRIRLIVSNVESGSTLDSTISLDRSFTDISDEVAGVASQEPLILTTDRSTAIYWPTPQDASATNQQGFYLTNPELAFVLDRFLSDTIWPLAWLVDGTTTDTTPTFPTQYFRIRDCLTDVKQIARTRSLDSLEVEFSGYDTQTGEAVTKRGTLVEYYLTEYDFRAFMTVELTEKGDSSGVNTVTVGGWHARSEDYEARTITIRERSDGSRTPFDDETRAHLHTCCEQLPETFGEARIAVGFDAFIDRKREFVARRTPDGNYDSIRDFSTFIETLVEFEAKEHTPRLEWTEMTTIPGGHTAHIGKLFAHLGYDVSIIGRLGDPVHPAFTSQFDDGDLLSIGPITTTDYVEFDERRLLLTEPNWDSLDWETIAMRVGIETLAEHIDGRDVLSVGSWSSMPAIPSVWDGLRNDLWPLLDSPPRLVHFSPSDIEWLSENVLADGVDALSTFDDTVPVTVTMARRQAKYLLDALDRRAVDTSLAASARILREELGVTQCIVHTFDKAVLVNKEETVSVSAPLPADAHDPKQIEEFFDFGVVLALTEDLSSGPSLILGYAVAQYVAQHDEMPTGEDLHAFLNT